MCIKLIFTLKKYHMATKRNRNLFFNMSVMVHKLVTEIWSTE